MQDHEMSNGMLCNHLACRCEVKENQDYCSDYCREEIYTGMEAVPRICRCGHEACGSRNNPAVST